MGIGMICFGLYIHNNRADFRLRENGDSNQYSESNPTEANPALSHFISIDKKLDSFSQDDKNLVDYVRLRYLTPPSHRPYPIESTSLAKERNRKANPFGDFVATKNGKFIDASCGNMTDVLLTSPTLNLERKLSWEGIVIGCNPFTVPSLKLNRRNSWVAEVCLSRKNTPHRMHMTFSTNGHQHEDDDPKPSQPSKLSLFQIMKPSSPISNNTEIHYENQRVETVEVQAVPLFSVISAVGWNEVDFLSLEMKGYEMDILKNIPWDKVTFKVMQVGIFTYNEKELAELDEYLELYDYMLVKDRVQDKYRVYVHMSISDIIYEKPGAYASLTSK
ncbi:unnamed protein product [Orchesella dallaii]|uniref:Methyltransferase FkbM domain-containing protein n=1 Tax=Orchesella dallaii TaxID=48710 RepID=A0ABP1RGN6_9HEXA